MKRWYLPTSTQGITTQKSNIDEAEKKEPQHHSTIL
jgi:hypothetical protein